MQVYRTQIRAFRQHEIAERLKVAAGNEQEHADTLTKRIKELRGNTSRIGIFYQVAGTILGFITTLLGEVSLL
jgi:demethoxyubiquinone hydroxylase (CLK1/Coq7/Cat5 family)